MNSLAPLRVAVEKEMLHHDILRVLSGAGLLTNLTFIGGTCLRACNGSRRLSEDLDFTGSADFTRDQLAAMSDILVAFALRPNRLKNRDLWDIAWLHQQQIKPALALIKNKLHDHHSQIDTYLQAFAERAASLQSNPEIVKEFRKEMARFLPNTTVKETVNSEKFWEYLSNLLASYHQTLAQTLSGQELPSTFRM